MIKHLVSIIILIHLCSANAAPKLSEIYKDDKDGVTYEKIDDNSYKLLLIKTGTADPSIGQELLENTANKLCGEQEYRYGKYQFDAREAVINEDSDLPDKLFFTQEIHCGEKHQESVSDNQKDPNWKPSEQDKYSAEKTLSLYLTYINDEKYSEAYKLLTVSMQEIVSSSWWIEMEKDHHNITGGEANFFNARATWYKDPQGASYPGIYSAFDLECKYKNINICSEVIILHKYKTDEFRVMRHERNIIDKNTEKKLKENQ